MADTDKHDGAQIVQCTMLQKEKNSTPTHTETITWLLNFSGLTPFLVVMVGCPFAIFFSVSFSVGCRANKKLYI